MLPHGGRGKIMEKIRAMVSKSDKAVLGVQTGFLLLYICLAVLVLPGIYRPQILPDEYGYWAWAAEFAGRDWSDISGNCSYYSFGYGILLLPLFALISDPVWLYRTAVLINFLLLYAGFLLLYYLLKTGPLKSRKVLAAGIAGTVMCYTAYLTYAQTTMAEELLTFLYILLAVWMYRYIQNIREGSAAGRMRSGHVSFGHSLLIGAGILLTAGYMYLVHNRTVGILLVTALFLPALTFAENKRAGLAVLLPVLFSVLVFFYLGAAGLDRHVAEIGTQGYRELANGNSYAGQLGKLPFLFSLQGIGQLLAGLAGKLFYLGVASFGLYYWGIAFLVRGFWKKRDPFFLWLLLSHGSALAISCISTLGTNRLDGLLYGRYHENTLPVILACGILAVLQIKRPRQYFLILVSLLTSGILCMIVMVMTGNYHYMNKGSVTGLFPAYIWAKSYDTITLLYGWLYGILGGGVLLFLAHLGKKRRILLATAGLWIFLTGYNTRFMILDAVEYQREEAGLVSQIREEAKEGKDRIVCFDVGMEKESFVFQYLLKDYKLQLVSVTNEEEWKEADIIITVSGSEGEAAMIGKEEWERKPSDSVFTIYVRKD